MEPFRRRQWRSRASPQNLQFFTCARPGRSKGNSGRVPDELVDKWVRGLPPGNKIVIVSLLGRKQCPDGVSEFSFYSFHGGWDRPDERRRKPSFQEWLDRRYKDRSFLVIEHPTTDMGRSETFPPGTLDAVACDISRLLREGRTVILMGFRRDTRTGMVCRYMGFTEDSRTA